MNDQSHFMIACFFFRLLEGIAKAACISSILSILMKVFPERISFVTALTEMLIGLGYMLGM